MFQLIWKHKAKSGALLVITAVLIIFDWPPDGVIPQTVQVTTVQNIPFGAGSQSTPPPHQVQPNIPPATILQYAFETVETKTAQEDIKKILLTKSNIILLWGMGKFLLAALLLLLLRFPFMKLESLELPWFKYKEKIEETEKISISELGASRKKEVNRWDVLYTIATDEVIYDSIVAHVQSQQSFDMSKVTNEIVTILSKLIEHFEVVSYVEVRNGYLDLNAMQSLSDDSATVVGQVYKDRVKKRNDQNTSLAVPLFYKDAAELSFTIIYVNAVDGGTLTGEDQMLILSVWEVVKQQLEAGMSEYGEMDAGTA